MNISEKKQSKISISTSGEIESYRYNSSGRIKRPVVINKKRNPLAYVVDWQLDEVNSYLLE